MKTKRRKLVAKNADRVQFLPPSSQSFFFPLSLHILFVLWKVTFNSIDIKRPKSSKKVLLFNSFVHKKAWESSRHFLANLCSWIVEVSALLFSHEAQSLSDCRVIDPDRNRGNRSLHFLACFFGGGIRYDLLVDLERFWQVNHYWADSLLLWNLQLMTHTVVVSEQQKRLPNSFPHW